MVGMDTTRTFYQIRVSQHEVVEQTITARSWDNRPIVWYDESAFRV